MASSGNECGGGGGGPGAEALLDERLKNIEPRMVELIMSEIMDRGPAITWDDIAGLEFAKNTIKVCDWRRDRREGPHVRVGARTSFLERRLIVWSIVWHHNDVKTVRN